MKNLPATITATLAEVTLVKNLVEKLADRRIDIGYHLEQVQPGHRAIEQSSIEAYVSGDIIFSDKDDLIIMPFDTSFLFTCTKCKEGSYNLTWASSLS